MCSQGHLEAFPRGFQRHCVIRMTSLQRTFPNKKSLSYVPSGACSAFLRHCSWPQNFVWGSWRKVVGGGLRRNMFHTVAVIPGPTGHQSLGQSKANAYPSKFEILIWNLWCVLEFILHCSSRLISSKTYCRSFSQMVYVRACVSILVWMPFTPQTLNKVMKTLNPILQGFILHRREKNLVLLTELGPRA